MVKRQTRYYVETNTGEQVIQRHRWTLLVINEPREINRLKEKIFNQLAPIDDFSIHYETSIRKSKGLYCKVFSFFSNTGKLEDKSEIYDSKNFCHSRDLSIQRDEVGWENYVLKIVRK